MKQILAMTRKELILWSQKPNAWVIVFVVPLLFIWIMGAVFGRSGTPVVTIYAVNEDDSQPALQVMQALRDADHLRLEILETRAEADRRVGAGERMAAVIVPEGFGERLASRGGATVEMIIDPARSEQAAIVLGLLHTALGPLMVEAEVSRGVEAGVAQIIARIENPGERETPAGETPAGNGAEQAPGPGETGEPDPTGAAEGEPAESDQMTSLRRFFTAAVKGVVSSQVQESLANPQVRLAVRPIEGGETLRRPSLLDYLVPGYSLMFVFFLIPHLALTVLEEREAGALRRLLVAPVVRSRILIGKMLAYFLLAVLQMAAILLAGRLIFGIDLGSSFLALLAVIIASALVMAALGILIAAFAQTESQADGLALIVVLTMAVVSGAMFPSIFIPGVQYLTPHYWAMQGFLDVIARGLGVEAVLLPVGVLLTMAAVFFTAGAIRFRFE